MATGRYGTARRKSSYREMREMMVAQNRRHKFGTASKIDGVVDDGLGCRSAHPDTGAGGQHGGDVSHQPPPQRIEVRVSLVSLVAGLFRVSFGWDMALSEQGAHCSAWCCFGKRRVETASMDTLSIYE